MRDASKLKPGRVLRSVYWLLDDSKQAVGIVRIRHYLNEALRIHGGHLGYYVRKDRRGLGYGRKALELGLIELKALGQTTVLLTVDSDNACSRHIIEAAGGQLEAEDTDKNGVKFCRYWIDQSAV